MQRDSFAKQLRNLVRSSDLTQNVIARKVGVSSAALSQFVHGTTLPTVEHLGTLLEVIKASPEQTSRMQYQLMMARSAPRHRNASGFNRRLFSLRTKYGLSLPQLSTMTGISLERLWHIESHADVKPNADEKSRLQRFFQNSRKDLSPVPAVENRVLVAENRRFGAPVLFLADLTEYDKSASLLEFAHRHFRDFSTKYLEHFEEPVIVRADSRSLQFPHRGMMEVIVARSRPDGFIPLELRCYANGSFRLWQPDESAFGTLNSAGSDDDNELLWSLPVVELTLRLQQD